MAPDLLTLFAEPSVALLYFMAVIVLSCAALFMALGQRMRGTVEHLAGRYTLASLGITLAWVALMVGAIIVLISGQPSAQIMPPLDRAVGTLVVVLVGATFLAPERQQSSTTWLEDSQDMPPLGLDKAGFVLITALTIVAVVVGYVITASEWYGSFKPGAEFNLSTYNTFWMVGTGALSLLMLILLVLRFRVTVDAPLKMIFLALILAGYTLTQISINNGYLRGNDSGVIRLTFLAAMLLYPVVVYRMVVDRLSAAIQEKATEATVSTLTNISSNLLDTTAERESVTLLKALGPMLENEKPDELPRQIVVAAVNMLKADVAALLVLDDAEYADVIAAYDNVQQRPIAAMAFKMDEQPTLQEAVRDRIQKVLIADKNLNELVDLYTRLDIQKIGPVYFQPLTREGTVLGVLVVALPYTQRDLRESEKRLLESIMPIASRVLAISRAAQREVHEARNRSVTAIVEGAERTQAAGEVSAARAEMQASLEMARNQINELSAKVRDLQIELDYERSRLAELAASDPEGLSITQRMEKMAGERSQLEAERERLLQALQEAQTQLATASGNEEELYEAAIRIVQQEKDELQTQKDQLEAQLTAIRAQGEAQAPAVLRDMLTRLSEEKARLAVERDQLKQQLDEVGVQLQALGIEGGPASMVSTLAQLTEERSRFKTLAERAAQDRDMLLTEIQHIQDRIDAEQQRDAKIAALENEVRRLAQDREVLVRQRDTLAQERDAALKDQAQLEGLRTRMVADLAALQSDLDDAIFERNRAAAERNKLVEERATLLTERDKLIAGRTALQTERDQLLARVEGNREMLERLGADGVGALKTMIEELTEERSELEHQLLQEKSSVQKLREMLEESKRKLAGLKTASPVGEDTAAVLLSVAQELRTPLSSIAAYVDLLLGESVGILGEMQRQFLQRVKANGDRLTTLIEDFVRVVAIDTGQLKLKAAPLDMLEVIDDAITATRTQFREKGITLKLEMPEDLPALDGDRGALQQVMVELLSNAYRASPTDGEVGVSARVEMNYKFPTRNGTAEQTANGIYIAVKDMGGGVPAEEQSRVFGRLYRADKPLIQGLGDTGVGLSIARALTEMHGGRIWLETTPGESSTFMLVIPLHAVEAAEKKAEYVAS